MQVIWLVPVLAFTTLGPVPVLAQGNSPWQMQESGTTAGLRGIDSVDGAVAWASGTDGTVLKTTDGGAHWTKCAVPDAATDGATLDFRGVQAWDAQAAIVMASGPGNKSRLYKTVDGCKTWRLLFKNPDSPEGFFDSFWLNGSSGMLLGDPVRGQLAVLKTENGGRSWSTIHMTDFLFMDARSPLLLLATAASREAIGFLRRASLRAGKTAPSFSAVSTIRTSTRATA